MNRKLLVIIGFLLIIFLGVSFPTAFIQTNVDGSHEFRITSDPDELANNVTGNIKNLQRFQKRFK